MRISKNSDMVMESSIGLMEHITRDNGFSTKRKVKGHFGMLRETFIVENSKMIWPTDMENILTLTDLSTREISETMCKRAMEKKNGLMGQSMLDPTKMA